MIAATYTADLYCDCEKCKADPFAYEEWNTDRGFSQYTGQSWSECARDARKDGWHISKDRQRAYAPGHKIGRVADE